MSVYVAVINVPGYMPMSDDPQLFATAQEAWEYLAEERERAEDEAVDAAHAADETPDAAYGNYSECVDELRKSASDKWPVCDFERVGTVYGWTPGREGDPHDLGLAYSVLLVKEECTSETGHVPSSDHRWQECPTYAEGV